MERKLASIQRIVSLSPIPGADMIEKATVLGWEVVVAKKDSLKVGDLIVYCEVDSILPDKPEFEFLRERKFRIRTIKLKGQVSQGIVFPMSVLPRMASVSNWGWSEGADVTDILGIRKYDPQAEAEKKETDRLAAIDKSRMGKFLKRYSWYRSLIFKPTRRPFPSFIRKTDEDRIQLFPDYYEKWGDLKFCVTEKLDGQSVTYFCIPNPKRGLFRKKWLFGVCSRNFQLLKPDNSSYWTLAKELNIEKIMIEYCKRWNTGWIIQGEAIGPRIQGNKYNRQSYELYVFNMMDYSSGKTTQYNQKWIESVCRETGINSVFCLSYNAPLLPTIPEMVEFAKGKSLLADIPREGIVVRNYDKNISFKVINPDFLLKYDL